MLLHMLEGRCVHPPREAAWDVLCFQPGDARKMLPLMPRVRSYQSQIACPSCCLLSQTVRYGHRSSVLGFPVHLASRVEVIPTGAEKKAPGSPARSSTLYFYVGLDHLAAGSDRGQEDGGLVVIDSDSRPRRSLRVRGVHPQLGGFEVAATVSRTSGTSKTGSSDEEQEGAMAAVNFLGKQNLRIGGVKDEVERLHAAHRRVRRKGDQREMAVVLPFLLPDELEAGSNVVLVQVQMLNGGTLNNRDTEPGFIFVARDVFIFFVLAKIAKRIFEEKIDLIAEFFLLLLWR